jgi:DNA-binding XRE family transcriptional regulator
MVPTTKTNKKTRVRAEKRRRKQSRAENGRLRSQLKMRPNLLDDDDPELPGLPPADEHGRYPAIETARIIIARQIIRARKAAGWTQAELAARASVRQETISRIETGKHSPGLKTMAKIDRALKRAGV